VEVMVKFGLEMLSKVPSTSVILQPSKKLFDSFMNKGSDNEQIYKPGFYLYYIKLMFLIKSGRIHQLIRNVTLSKLTFFIHGYKYS